jgi:hypothetical protein
MNRNRLLAVSVLVITAVVIAACAGDPPEFPLGRFESSGGRAVEFKPDNTYTVGFATASNPTFAGTFSVDRDKITVVEQCEASTCGAECTPGEDVAGTYSWDYEDETLTFEVVDEVCPNRTFDFAGVRYKIQP